MRIISPFHDFYDSVQATGQDRTLVYVRTPTTEDCHDWPFPMPRFWLSGALDLQRFVIGFCGAIYPCLHVSVWSNTRQKREGTHCYTMEWVDAFVAGHLHKRAVARWHDKRRGESRRFGLRTQMAQFFRECQEKRAAYGHLFEQKRVPVFVAAWEHQRGPHKFVWNAALKDLDFVRVKDPWTAFQEIAQFLGGLAFPDKGIPHVSDEDLAAAKGFDRFSFRKEPSKRKGK